MVSEYRPIGFVVLLYSWQFIAEFFIIVFCSLCVAECCDVEQFCSHIGILAQFRLG